MARTGKRRKKTATVARTSQIIFGERQSLRNALRLVQNTRMAKARRDFEEQLLRGLIQIRTLELNRINPDWDRKVRRATSRRARAAELQRLAASLPRDDYYLARLLSDHPNTPPKVLSKLARHPYRAARENVARHPRTPVATLRALCRDRREPLWYLVAFNPGAPQQLRNRLLQRIKRRGMKL